MSLLDQLMVWTLPWVPKAIVKQFAKRYVAGETLEEALTLVRGFRQDGFLCTLDVLGEFIHTPEEAYQAVAQYKDILAALDKEQLSPYVNVSVKPSQMGLLLDHELCYEILRDLVSTAHQYGNFVRVEMEDTQCTSDTISLFLRLRSEFSNVGIVLQAYLRRTLEDARAIMEAGGGHFRLCKGIYIEPRELAYKDKDLINKNYARVLEEMFKGGAYVGIATHDEKVVWEAQRLIDQYQMPANGYEFQMLLGVDAQLRNIIHEAGHPLRVYVPFGQQWYAYCMRRLRENPTLARYTLQNLLKSLTGSSTDAPKPKLAKSTKPLVHSIATPV